MDIFYVYAYLRANNSKNGPKGSPYYIGKGKGRRAYDKAHSVPLPADRSLIVILADGMTEPDALQAEMLLIHLHGRIDLGAGCLRNRTDGGDGVAGASAEVRKRISDKLKQQGVRPPSRKGSTMPRDVVEHIRQKTSATHRANGYVPKMAGWNKGVKMGPSPQKGIPLSQTHVEALRRGWQNKASRQRMAEVARNRPKFQCPHCAGFYIAAHLARYHGDKCKKVNHP